MRRIVLALAVVGTVAGVSAPALAKPDVPPVPVGVSHNDHEVCVSALSWVPQCVQTGAVR